MNSTLKTPNHGEQYAFEIDLKACTGCKGCVTACQNLNGLQPEESWRTVGVVESTTGSISQTITTSCHHCLDPACMSGCPTGAYIKDENTGIVKHLDDQCIGCQYCILRCPYDAPKWIPELKIVRKCDMCSDRLEVGEETACQQGCPNDAIKIVVKPRDEITGGMHSSLNIEVDRKFTFPTTDYVNGDITQNDKSLETTRKPDKGHLPLVLLLVFSQFSLGLLGLSFFLEEAKFLEALAAVTLLVGLGSSIFHLGHPLKSYRAFLGLKTSWLSREAILLGVYLPLLLLVLAIGQVSGLGLSPPFSLALSLPLKILASIFGALGVYSSAKLYETAPRPYWKGARALIGFPLTGLILSASFALSFARASEAHQLLLIIMAVSLLWVGYELTQFQKTTGLLGKSHKLLTTKLRGEWLLQQYSILVFGLFIPLWVLQVGDVKTLGTFIFYGLLCGSLIERHLFFKVGLGPQMPQGEAG